jgi:hypothetical protein
MSKAEILFDLSWEDYAAIDAVNLSTLKEFGRAPIFYRHRLDHGDKDTIPKAFGRATHLSVLEPALFADKVAVWTGGDRRGKEWTAFKVTHADAIILKEPEFDRCMAMSRSVRANRYAADLIAGGRYEVSVVWTDEATGIRCKCRIDCAQAGKALADLKTTRNASLDGFARESWRYGYHIQAAMNTDAWQAATGEVLPFHNIAVENEAPHVCQVYRVPEYVVDAGRETYRDWLKTLACCRSEGIWPGYADGIVDLTPPKWALDVGEDEDLSGLGLEFGAEQETGT